MRTSIGQGVEKALDLMMAAEYTGALVALRPALDETARRYYKAYRQGTKHSVRFLEKHGSLIGKIGLEDAEIGKRDFVFPPLDRLFIRRKHSFGRVIYYFMKQKEKNRKRKIQLLWDRNASLRIIREHCVILDPMLISGIIASVVSCRVNEQEVLSRHHWLPSSVVQTPINDLWGKAGELRQKINME